GRGPGKSTMAGGLGSIVATGLGNGDGTGVTSSRIVAVANGRNGARAAVTEATAVARGVGRLVDPLDVVVGGTAVADGCTIGTGVAISGALVGGSSVAVGTEGTSVGMSTGMGVGTSVGGGAATATGITVGVEATVGRTIVGVGTVGMGDGVLLGGTVG